MRVPPRNLDSSNGPRAGKGDVKGKGKAVASSSSSDVDWSSDSSIASNGSYASSIGNTLGDLLRHEVPLKLKTRNIMMESVKDVKIFEKEVRAGEL